MAGTRPSQIGAPPLLESKFHVPPARPRPVLRPRLTGRLDVAALPPLTVVAAPAGFGKTTLLTEWLAGVGGDEAFIAWLSLDERDNEPRQFWAYVVSAVQAAATGVGAEALQQ